MNNPPQPAVLVVGPLPPPLQGAAATTQAFVAQLSAAGPVQVCNNAIGATGGRGRRALVKFARTLRALGAVATGAPRPGRALYMALDGGLGLAYNLAVVALARLLGYRLYLHHHSFAYINARSCLMAMLCRAAGRNATHVVLCGGMGTRLAQRYSHAGHHAFVLTSAAMVDLPTAIADPAARKEPGFTIGFLSNLIIDKGVDDAIALVREGRRRGMDIRLLLAGRATEPAAATFVAAAKAELGPALNVLGAIPEDAKAEFFAALDLFAFPTRYVNEAEPRAVIEALMHGVPVLTTQRGCLPELVDDSVGAVVAPDHDLVARGLALAEDWVARPAVAEAARRAAAERGRRLARDGQDQVATLVRRLHGRLET